MPDMRLWGARGHQRRGQGWIMNSLAAISKVREAIRDLPQRGDKIWLLLCKITAAAWRTDLFLGGGHKEKKPLAPIQASDAGGVVWPGVNGQR